MQADVFATVSFVAGVVDTGEQLIASVNNTGGKKSCENLVSDSLLKTLAVGHVSPSFPSRAYKSIIVARRSLIWANFLASDILKII